MLHIMSFWVFLIYGSLTTAVPYETNTKMGMKSFRCVWKVCSRPLSLERHLIIEQKKVEYAKSLAERVNIILRLFFPKIAY